VYLLFQFDFAKKGVEIFLLKLFLKFRNFGMNFGVSWITFSKMVFMLDETKFYKNCRSEKASGVISPFNTVRYWGRGGA